MCNFIGSSPVSSFIMRKLNLKLLFYYRRAKFGLSSSKRTPPREASSRGGVGITTLTFLLDILKLGKRFELALGFKHFFEEGVFSTQFVIVFGGYLAQFFVNILGNGEDLVAVSPHFF